MAKRKPDRRRPPPRGGMTPDEFRLVAQRAYGDDWPHAMAREFGVDRVTIWRWRTGRSTISVPIAIALRSKAPPRRPRP